MALNEKLSQEYLVNAGVPQGSILGSTLFLLYISDFPDDAICIITIYANDTTYCTTCDHSSDLWQQLKMAVKLESDLWHIVGLCQEVACWFKCL